MNTYDFELQRWNFPYHNFKQRAAEIMINSVHSTHFLCDVKFSCYAALTFKPEDTQLRYPHVEELESFNRLKTNCIVFDVDNIKYNKLFICQYLGRTIESYVYMLYNTETGAFHHCFGLPHDMGDLCIDIKKVFFTVNNKSLNKF